MLSKFVFAALLCGLTLGVTPPGVQPPGPTMPQPPGPAPMQPAPTAEPAVQSAPAPSSKQTAEFTNFFTQVLAGHVPSANMSPQMRAGFTSQLLGQIDGAFAGLGKFRELQFVSADTMQQYARYHYRAVFEQGSQGIMFVLDSSGSIVGFFQDQASSNPQ
jgi:hypothetical protein